MDNIKISQTPHRSVHIEIAHAFYFLSCHTINDRDIFVDESRKQILFNTISHATKLFGAKIYGYILWPDHYHLIVQLPANTLSKFTNNVHTYSAKSVNSLDNQPGRRVWYQYWDRLLRIQYSLDDLYRHVNYIMHNPIKHGWCKTFDDAITYKWSSIPHWARKYGRDGLWECWTKYPVKDLSDYN